MVLLTIFVLLAVVYSADSLECYSCRDVHDLTTCNTTQRCYDGQACFRNTTSGSVQLSSLGCIDYRRCGVHVHILSSIVGREIHVVGRQTSGCFECCTTDKCNNHLCEHLQPSICIDDESIDCAKLNTLFGICSDIDHAKSVCPNFCGLCNVGPSGGVPGPYTGQEEAYCMYKGQYYRQDLTWNDGCTQSCTCTNAAEGKYSCRAICLNWNGLPPICHMEAPKPGLCCTQPRCPDGIIINIPIAYKAEYPGYVYV